MKTARKDRFVVFIIHENNITIKNNLKYSLEKFLGRENYRVHYIENLEECIIKMPLKPSLIILQEKSGTEEENRQMTMKRIIANNNYNCRIALFIEPSDKSSLIRIINHEIIGTISINQNILNQTALLIKRMHMKHKNEIENTKLNIISSGIFIFIFCSIALTLIEGCSS